DRSGARPEGVATRHRDPPPQGGREMSLREIRNADPPGGTAHPDPLPRGGREISPTSGGGDGAGGVEGVARDRTVPRLAAVRPIVDRRRADGREPPKFAGIEWTSGALA
ncbi:MAG: hypothetical protein QOH92_407, partial [Chloroflexota bacterium]|nr:hypothetical protein [Chloroflexota bacterium]